MMMMMMMILGIWVFLSGFRLRMTMIIMMIEALGLRVQGAGFRGMTPQTRNPKINFRSTITSIILSIIVIIVVTILFTRSKL